MKKIMLFALISALSLSLLTGCGEEKKEPDSQDVSKVEESQTVRLTLKRITILILIMSLFQF